MSSTANKPFEEISKENNDFEQEYSEIVQKKDAYKPIYHKNLRQPSPYKHIETWVTYGTCEDPLR